MNEMFCGKVTNVGIGARYALMASSNFNTIFQFTLMKELLYYP